MSLGIECLLSDDPARCTRLAARLDELNREDGLTVVLITHEREVAARAQRRLFLRDGRLEALA